MINYYIDGFCLTPEDTERTRDAFFSELNDIKIDIETTSQLKH